MSYDVGVVEVSAVPFVYVERHGTRDQIGALAMPALDIVWTAVRAAADTWGSDFVDLGPKGHINAVSGLGAWDEGWEMLQEFVARPEL